MTPSVLVLGIGNILMSDDGLGPYVVSLLENDPRMPPHAALVDGGTKGLELMPCFEGIEYAVIVDAVISADKPPGTLVRVGHDQLLDVLGQKMSVHEIGIVDLLNALRLLGKEPRRIELLGLVPERVDFAYGLSKTVKQRAAAVADAVCTRIEQWHTPHRNDA